jgi:hypothetical protein
MCVTFVMQVHNQAQALAIKAEAMLQRMQQHNSAKMQIEPAQQLPQTQVGSHVHAKLDHQTEHDRCNDARRHVDHDGCGEDEVLCAQLIYAAMAQTRAPSPVPGGSQLCPWDDRRVRAEMNSLAGALPPLCMDMALFDYMEESGAEAHEAIPLDVKSVLEPRDPLDLDEKFLPLDRYIHADVFF